MASEQEFPTGEEIEKLRAEFVQYQYGWSQFSDHYSVVARFAWEKMRQTRVAISSGDPA